MDTLWEQLELLVLSELRTMVEIGDCVHFKICSVSELFIMDQEDIASEDSFEDVPE